MIDKWWLGAIERLLDLVELVVEQVGVYKDIRRHRAVGKRPTASERVHPPAVSFRIPDDRDKVRDAVGSAHR